MSDPSRGVNDYGGEAAGAVDRAEHELSLYEKRIDAMLMLVSRADNPICVDAHRRAQEQLSKENYDRLPYYDRWLVTLKRNLVEAGLLAEDEIDRRLAEIRARLAREGHGA
jgi:hypothetical protein